MSTSTTSQISWDELERKHKANQLKDWVVTTFPDITNKKIASSTSSNHGITLEKVFTSLISGSIRSDNPFQGIVILRAFLQHLPANRLHSLVIPEDLMKWLTSYANDTMSIKTIQRATVLSVIVQLLKGCSLLNNQRVIPYLTRILDFNLTTLYDEVKTMVLSLHGKEEDNESVPVPAPVPAPVPIPATASTIYVGNVMVIHQLEDIVLILGSTNQSIELINSWPLSSSSSSLSSSGASSSSSFSSPLLMPIKLMSELMRIGTNRLNSPHGEQFDLDICKIFAMLSEIIVSNYSASPSPSSGSGVVNGSMVKRSIDILVASSSVTDDLLNGLDKVIELVLQGKVVHDSYLSAFHHGLELLVIVLPQLFSMKDNSVRYQAILSRLFSIYERIIAAIHEVSLDNVVSAKRIEICIGAISSFFEEVAPLSTTASASAPAASEMKTIYHCFMMQDNNRTDLLDLFMHGVSQLQTRMKEALVSHQQASSSSSTTTTTSSADQLKDFKIIFSDIRKGCISTLDHVLTLDQQWLRQSTKNRKLFWELSMKQLQTPILFSSAYQSVLSQYPIYVKMMVEYLAKALTMISQYSLTASEDIVETIKQLLLANCQELLFGGVVESSTRYEVNILPLLLQCLHQFPKSCQQSIGQQYKWKTTICLTIQEAYALICRQSQVGNVIHHDLSVLNATKALISRLFQEIIQEHIKANSSFSSNNASTGKGKKSNTKGKMKEVDGSVELYHAACTSFTTICDYLLLIKASSPFFAISGLEISTQSWQEMILCCLEGILKPLVFEDDLVDILLTSDLLARLVVLLTQGSESLTILQNNDLFIASLVALTVCGSLKKEDLISERLSVTLKLFVTETLANASTAATTEGSSNTKNLFFQVSNILGSANASTCEVQEENETMLMSANASMSLIMDKIVYSAGQASRDETGSVNMTNRLELLRRVINILK
jgi:hypothetical protein